MNKIVLIDYGMGNLRSVQKAFERQGAKPLIAHDARTLEKADKIILPGVGAFKHAMMELKKRNLIPTLKAKIKSGTPYLGLCLGLQLLFTDSEEGNAKGLGIIEGSVKRFSARGGSAFGGRSPLKVPHMGWNTLTLRQKKCPLFKGVKKLDSFYFVHSYYAVPKDRSWTAAVTPYGGDFCSAVWKDNIFATQFHPEKSQAAGLRLIKNFIEYKTSSPKSFVGDHVDSRQKIAGMTL